MDIGVSVICNAYNHEKYIRDALEGFVTQKTNFKYEVLINDDSSKDNTATIIKEYELKYPDIIKPIYQSENLYSKGISITKTIQLPRVKGKYIAVCEGDDYWTDIHKLQRQYDILENNKAIDMCAHIAEEIDGKTGAHVQWIAPRKNDGILSLKQVIKGGGAYLATASLFYRKEVDINPVAFRDFYHLDYTLQVAGALKGGIYFIAKPMSVYRIMTPDSWTNRLRLQADKKIKHKKKMRTTIKMMDRETNYEFHFYFIKELIDNYVRTVLLHIKSGFQRIKKKH